MNNNKKVIKTLKIWKKVVCKKAQVVNTNHVLKALQEQQKIFKKKYIENKIEKTRNRSRNGKGEGEYMYNTGGELTIRI